MPEIMKCFFKTLWGEIMRKEDIDIREWIIAGIFIAVGVLLPMLFHSVGIAGQIFLPMHIPVLIAGFLISPIPALLVGVITPLLSSILTGMPLLFPIAVIMMIELGVYGALSSVLTRSFKWKKLQVLFVSMTMGRIAAGLTVYALIQLFGIKMNALLFIKGAILTGLPGIAMQILLIPMIVRKIRPFLNMNKYREQKI